TSLQKVHQWNRTKHDSEPHTELLVPPGEPPSLLRSQQGERNTPKGPAQVAVTIDIKAMSYDDGAPVDTQLKLRRDGKFESKLPAAWDLEESKEVVYRIQNKIRTLITTPDGEILHADGNEKN